jgi:EAL domain-containing protein (putative c-di-GMP-specific phosphodiesterase class I)
MERDLRRALADHEFLLHYQPLCSLAYHAYKTPKSIAFAVPEGAGKGAASKVLVEA